MGVQINIRNLTKKFGNVTALDKINLTIESGQFFALLGPSGCGKTTLLRCLAGLEKPDQGEILIGNQVVFSSQRGIMIPPGKRNLGMVFQSYALWPHMTTLDNIGFGLRLQKVSRKETKEQVNNLLGELGLDNLGSRYPSELSGGQQQRVAVARLLATRPPIFLMDEPLSNLDARLRLDMRSDLKRIHYESGATTVYVTHDQTEAMTMASKVVVMKEGRCQQIASPQDVYNQPANLFVAEFVGMPRINLLPAQLVKQNGKPWLKIDDFKLKALWQPAKEKLIAAVRPEDVKILTEPEEGSVEFKVYVVQPCGPELFINIRRNKTILIVRENRQINLQMDQPVWIKINSSAISLYNEDTGLLLKRG